MSWQDVLDFWNTLTTYVQLWNTAFGVFVGLSIKKICQFFKRAKLRKLLSLNKNDCEVIVPVRRGLIVFEEDEDQLRSKFLNSVSDKEQEPKFMRIPYDYVTYDEAKILLEMQKILLNFKRESKIKFLRPDSIDMRYNNTKFCFGSVKSNDYVRNIFSMDKHSPFRFKEKFLFGCTTKSYTRRGSEHLKPLKKIADDLDGKVLFIGDTEIPYKYDEDYIALIKISKSKFGDKKHGTLHMCFGDSGRAPLIAAKCYTEHIDILYKKLKVKKHLKNYFVIMRCSKNDEVDFRDDSFLDITDRMIG